MREHSQQAEIRVVSHRIYKQLGTLHVGQGLPLVGVPRSQLAALDHAARGRSVGQQDYIIVAGGLRALCKSGLKRVLQVRPAAQTAVANEVGCLLQAHRSHAAHGRLERRGLAVE